MVPNQLKTNMQSLANRAMKKLCWLRLPCINITVASSYTILPFLLSFLKWRTLKRNLKSISLYISRNLTNVNKSKAFKSRGMSFYAVFLDGSMSDHTLDICQGLFSHISFKKPNVISNGLQHLRL